MRRQVKGGKAGRGQRRKTLTRRNLPKAGGGRRSLAAGKETNIERLIRERDDALEQLASTSDVLKVISRSTFDLQAVLDALIATAAQLCRADMGILRRRVGDVFELAATCGVKTEWRKVIADHPNRPGRHSIIGRAAASGKTVQVADVLEDPEYVNTATQTLIGFRGILVTPMVRDGSLIGTLGFFKLKPGLFSPKQVGLIENFAAQAVIAIENTRLLNELRQRTDDLSEALEQQTATSEVLKIISGSPDELEPVFQAMLGNATRICQAQFGALFRYENDAFYPATSAGVPHALAEFWQQRASFLPPAGSPLDRLLKTRGVIFTNDAAAEPVPGAPARLGGARSLVAVPMFKDDALVGAIVIYRQEVQPFTEKQIALVSNFAAQAVIAIENARLLNELRQRTDDLSESLEQQTATSAVLKVISSSPGELEPVFQAMLENATRICHAKFGTLYLLETDSFRAVAIHNAPSAYVHARKGQQVRPPPDSALGQVATTRQVAQIADATKLKSYIEGNPYAVSAAELGGYRTIAAVPMLKDNELVGAILIYRQEVRPFSEKQIALLQNFAAQAVIAIENARLLN